MLGIMKTKTYLLLFLITIFLSSCTTVYIPPEVNTPIFKDEHTFSAGLSYSLCGTNVNAGYSFTKHIAAITSASFLNTKNSDNEDFQNYGEFGIGYFYSKKFEREQGFSFEIFGGYGFANARSKDVKFNVTEEGHYYRIFVQPDFAYSFGWIDLDAAIKFSSMKFTSYQLSGRLNATGSPSAFGWEPVFTIRIGSPLFKVKYQLGISNIIESNNPFFGKEAMISSIGAVVQF